MSNWSPQQEEALDAVGRFLKSDERIFRLFGYAGTGKTTLAKHLAEGADGKVLYGAFTGKASLVMRSKGMEAQTLHSLLYKVETDKRTGLPHFILDDDSPLKRCSLLVVDEVSMVGEDLGKDIMSFPMKVLVLGDPYQLPPIHGAGFFTEAKPDYMLTEIHRQAQDNPIIRYTMAIREGGSFEGEGINFIDRRDEEVQQAVLDADQVIVGTNKNRTRYNQRIRKLLGIIEEEDRASMLPRNGEKLVCLKNNHTSGFLNGSQWQLVHQKTDIFPGVRQLDLRSLDSLATNRAMMLDKFWYGQADDLHWRQKKDSDEFTFGYVMTCHKAQGSQWDSVTVFDESGVFGPSRRQWLYTAATRAAETLTVVM